jgi:hypothetical protein
MKHFICNYENIYKIINIYLYYKIEAVV